MAHVQRVLRGALLWLGLVSGAVLAQPSGSTPMDGVPLRATQPSVQVEPAPATATAAPIESLFPPLTGRVVDSAQLLTPSAQVYLTQMLERLEQSTTDQVVVVTVPSLGGYSIEEFGLQLGRHWGIGQKDKNNGVLLLVAKDDRQVRIEVGYGLEGRIDDIWAHLIINDSIIPYFKDELYSSGIITGTTSIVRLLEPNSTRMLEHRWVEQSWYQQIEWMWWFKLVFFSVFVGVPLVGLLLFTRDDGAAASAGRPGTRDDSPRAERDSSSSSSSFDWFDSSSSSSSSSSDSDSFRGGGGSFGGGGASGSW
ncbi:TPM domain-containing protein [Pseudomonas sp. TKO26]|uniref:TPM domain-containing protein n=1 Tax=unclassified Pseudomonas TaxID=196821 RepID=UPI000D81C698|nr:MULTISPECIES: TPM domain-containing protein [unclassified Pseudomonas]PYY82483.1 TPM domain-containing protein [Pseudomonas sp. TKO30]PYY84018.1 TPM domain-containing protein [Pseudomonas sp. TKO29]PYY86244.1 TPM domain-containing protein [Pseudomonas sp. TKO26]PYY98116.1 TPM domain-containing protein [Pseudomonas sp. TKO14]